MISKLLFNGMDMDACSIEDYVDDVTHASRNYLDPTVECFRPQRKFDIHHQMLELTHHLAIDSHSIPAMKRFSFIESASCQHLQMIRTSRLVDLDG